MADHRYRVIKRLEAGGMAEVYLGEATGVEGFKKRVAIKRVLPHLAQNENFIRMFLDEARLSARLNHANIVSVFDISAREDTYFLIMEFVDGANLKKILESLHRRGQRFKLAEAIYVCAEAARGLSYAHELHDENGRALGIVHRDISPPNIMLTKRGEVKVADFGLAKAGTQLSQTDPGVVKGKFSYLSPEAANGKEVDARADVFSLGIVLWEMLAGRRLFLGETDYATVKLVQGANIPRLSPLNNQVDDGFEEILWRALTREPEARYQSAHEFGDALTGYLFARQLKVTSFDIATLVKTAISSEDVVLPTKNETSLIDRLIQEELDESVGLGGEAKKVRTTPTSGLTPVHEGELEDPASWFTDEVETARLPSPRPEPRRSNPATTGWRESGVEPAPEPDDEDDTRQRIVASSIQPLSLEPDPPSSRPPMPDLSPQPAGTRANGAAVAKRPGSGKYVVMAMAFLVVLAVAIALLGRSF
ncbi:MAG TPA: protein kinase [Polyangiales bacterium]|nr:protein kinase [Polyangiales bacterium]